MIDPSTYPDIIGADGGSRRKLKLKHNVLHLKIITHSNIDVKWLLKKISFRKVGCFTYIER